MKAGMVSTVRGRKRNPRGRGRRIGMKRAISLGEGSMRYNARARNMSAVGRRLGAEKRDV